MTFLSKSKYLGGLQCSKLLWYNYNAKEEIPPPGESTQAIFDQGHQVGELAKTLFPGGIEIQGSHTDFEEVLRRSTEALSLGKPLYEPAFRYGNAYARADILVPARGGRWDIVEVKSSTAVKDVHIQDLALQKYAYSGAGLDIRKCALLLINSDYQRGGDVEPEKLFVKEDVTSRVESILPRVGANLQKMMDVIRLRESPDVSIGPWCDDPYECPLKGLCWDFLPERSVFDLTRIGSKAFDLLEKGIVDVADLPLDFRGSPAQAVQIKALTTGRPFVKKASIRDFLARLVYPLYYLDFETFATAIPLFDRVRPYQQIPFQFSLHVVNEAGQAPEHHGFIADGKKDPRPEILGNLKALLGSKGSIVSYNAAFEKNVLKQSSQAYLEFTPFWESIGKRFVDLLAPFRSFSYYNPSQGSSASMKEVLPALTGKSYEWMEIAEGGKASREYLRVTFGDVPDEEKVKVRNQLEE